ncbi:hypothetical protein LAZ67_14003461 [Cordylochernes scorpioides]|uniref:CCHC-type domain-containing protein n=1 Tax=Cordylochernes scorpioides TaxID=51811 RepID=A0ABY6L7L0_9ARAC|nr:hypothetical protein LAZ67_14003461 [Cordylochernes scorpioides]
MRREGRLCRCIVYRDIVIFEGGLGFSTAVESWSQSPKMWITAPMASRASRRSSVQIRGNTRKLGPPDLTHSTRESVSGTCWEGHQHGGPICCVLPPIRGEDACCTALVLSRLSNKFKASPSIFAAQFIDTPPPDLRDVIHSEVQQTLAPISAPRQPESFRPRRQYLPQIDQGSRRRTERPSNNQRIQWRTEDERPICFHCGRPGHVTRYCRDKRQAFADARLGRETVDFGRPRTENYTMGESGSELSQGRFRNPSPYPNSGRIQAPRTTSKSPARRPSRSPSRRNGASSGGEAATDENPPCCIAAKMEKNWISANIQVRKVQALVETGAEFSVIYKTSDVL